MAITKAEAKQRRWVKQRIGYLESDNARIVKSIHQRLSDLEVLLLSPTKTPAYAVYEVDGLADAGLPEPKFGSSLVDCPQCRELLKSRCIRPKIELGCRSSRRGGASPLEPWRGRKRPPTPRLSGASH